MSPRASVLRVAPFTRAKDLAKQLGVGAKEVLKEVGWTRHKTRYSLSVDGSDARLSPALERGMYSAHSVKSCLVPAAMARALGEARQMQFELLDPEPPPPPLPPPPSASGTGVVAVLAHVDHGKTTLLDALLGTEVTAHEAGGITQCVRPSLLALDHSSDDGLRTLAFLDTPGHTIFTGMRAAAADGADLALVLVAIDAGVQRQTREVVRRCAELRQPMAFALTKADLAGSSAEEAEGSRRVNELRRELLALWEAELARAGCSAVEQSAPIPLVSAPHDWGLPELLDSLRRQLIGATARHRGGEEPTEIATSHSAVNEGVALVLEVASTHGLGSTLLAVVRSGELRLGMHFVCGAASGRVRSLGVASVSDAASATGDSRIPSRAATLSFRDVRSAGIGEAARVAVAWDNVGGTFEVGELLRAGDKREARALAEYRTMCELLLASRQPLAEPIDEMTAAAPQDALADADVEAAEYDHEEGELYGDAVAAEATVTDLEQIALARLEAAEEAEEAEAGLASGAAAVIKAQSAGELQAMLDFLETRKARRPGAAERLVLVSSGVGQPRHDEMLMVKDALSQKVPCAIYALSLHVPQQTHRAARQMGVEIKEYSVFHDLLTDLLHSAGLQGPARELADMRDSGSQLDGSSSPR